MRPMERACINSSLLGKCCREVSWHVLDPNSFMKKELKLRGHGPHKLILAFNDCSPGKFRLTLFDIIKTRFLGLWLGLGLVFRVMVRDSVRVRVSLKQSKQPAVSSPLIGQLGFSG